MESFLANPQIFEYSLNKKALNFKAFLFKNGLFI